jgi:hypothetical protein
MFSTSASPNTSSLRLRGDSRGLVWWLMVAALVRLNHVLIFTSFS